MVDFADLLVEGPEVVKDANEQEPTSAQVKQAGDPFAKIKAVEAEAAEKGQQQPGDGVVGGAGDEASVGLTIHEGDEKEIDEPADEQEPGGEEPNCAGDGFAVIKSVGAGESKNPQEITDELAVGVVTGWHGDVRLAEARGEDTRILFLTEGNEEQGVFNHGWTRIKTDDGWNKWEHSTFKERKGNKRREAITADGRRLNKSS